MEPDAGIKTNRGLHPEASKGNPVLNDIRGAVNSEYEWMTSNDLDMQTFSVVKDNVSNFAKNSKILMGALDEVAKLHPFIKLAVSMFKAGLMLELTRRENDNKVIALNLTMCDMMGVLRILDKVADPTVPGPDGLTIEERLKERMSRIVVSIKHCAKVCDSYQKEKLLVRFLSAINWRAEFTNVVQQFKKHKAELRDDLQTHISIGITIANRTLRVIGTEVGELKEMMKAIFDRMQSPEEREVATLVANSDSIEEALKDKAVLKKVIAAQDSKEGKGTKRRGGKTEEDKTINISELLKDVRMGVEQVLADNKPFEKKFEAMMMQVDQVKDTVRHEADRIIGTVLSGPHDRIKDGDMYHVWKEMGWKGSVKAKHLVMALRDHFKQSLHNSKSPSGSMSTSQAVVGPTGNTDMANRVDRDAFEEDRWTLEYLTVVRVQALIEALDEDVSSFVTISEVNAFTAARPLDWSLPHWITYWTLGFEMTAQWYFRRIRKVFAEIHNASNVALPSNFKPISEFVGCWQTRWAEDLLSGLRDVWEWDYFDWEDDRVFRKFKSYVVENEARMECSLRRVKYYLDAANTLIIVAGEGRPEKYVLPLIFLLMRRALWIVRQADKVTLHELELEVISDSLSTLADAVYDRVSTLQAMYKLQNQNKKDQFSKVFYGLYRYAFEEAQFGSYWLRSQSTDAFRITEDVTTVASGDADSEDKPVELFYGQQKEGLELLADPALVEDSDGGAIAGASDALAIESEASHSSSSLVGHWSGAYAYDGINWGSDGPVSLSISAHGEGGSISGSGTDAFGPFTVKGTLEGDKLTFLMEYVILQHGNKVAWRCQGTVHGERDRITGTWGRPDADTASATECEVEDGSQESADEDSAPPANETGEEPVGTNANDNDGGGNEKESNRSEDKGEKDGNGTDEDDDDSTSAALVIVGGTFFLKRRPLEYLLACPSDEEFAENRPRALWRLAINYTIRAIRSRTLTSRGLAERRRQRRRYIELSRFKKLFRMDATRAREWRELVKGIHPDDLHLWHCIDMFQDRRDPVHIGIGCDSCHASPFPGANGTTPFSPSRYLCIDCSQKEVDHSVDLCADCFINNKSATRGDIVHIPTHNILQLRTTRLRVYKHDLLSAGSSAAQCASTLVDSGIHVPAPVGAESGASCVECEEQVKERPFWYCIDCHKSTFICCECNSRVEKEKPWLLQWCANTDYHNTHDWSHTLVFVPDPDVGGEAEQISGLSTEQRLARMEEKLEKQSAAFTSRLAALKELLERLVPY